MNTYALCEKNRVGNYKEKKENYDLINITFICIGHLNGKNDVGVIRLLNVIFTDQLDIESKKKILKKEFGIQMTVEFEKEVSTMCNLSQGLIEKGIQEGIEIGKKQGEENMLIKSIKNLIEKAGWTAQEAMTVLGIDPNMYDVYLRKLQENISSSVG